MDPAIDSAEVTLALSGVLRLARSRLDDFTTVRGATDGFVRACFLPDIRGSRISGRQGDDTAKRNGRRRNNPIIPAIP